MAHSSRESQIFARDRIRDNTQTTIIKLEIGLIPKRKIVSTIWKIDQME